MIHDSREYEVGQTQSLHGGGMKVVGRDEGCGVRSYTTCLLINRPCLAITSTLSRHPPSDPHTLTTLSLAVGGQ